MISGLWPESPKRVSRTVQTLFRTRGNNLKRGFAPCKRLFWDSHSRDPKTPFAPSLKHFWAFWLFRHLYQASGVANLATQKVGPFRIPGSISQPQRRKWWELSGFLSAISQSQHRELWELSGFLAAISRRALSHRREWWKPSGFLSAICQSQHREWWELSRFLAATSQRAISQRKGWWELSGFLSLISQRAISLTRDLPTQKVVGPFWISGSISQSQHRKW